jgi:hypothetical protein
MDTDQILDSVELMAGVDRDGARLAVDATCSPWLSGSAGRPPPGSPGGCPASWRRR